MVPPLSGQLFGDEKQRIAERIKDFIKNEKPSLYRYIMLRNGRILVFDDYRGMVNSGGTNPQDAYVYISTDWVKYKADFYYPFLYQLRDFLIAYLSKLGFHYLYFIAPATGLKYVAFADGYEKYISEKYLLIELVNLDTVINNTNLPKIVAEVLVGKLISGKKELTASEYFNISEMFKSQKLFAGHNFEEAGRIIYEYYDEGNQSLAKEVARIVMDYYRIFHPYTVCYETRTWKEVECWSIKP